jgi:gas vesicle protein
MSIETDALAAAAQRFSEAIRAERATTFEALEAERQAALQIIAALKAENDRHARASGGKFAFGLVLGIAVGVAAVTLLAPRSGQEARRGLRSSISGSGGPQPSLTERVQAAINSGQRAAAEREQELWNEYRQRLAAKPQPPEMLF